MASPPISIRSDRLTAHLSPDGAELVGLTLDQARELQWNGDPTVWKGRAPILFPNIGFLNGGAYRYEGAAYTMPKHGFARDMPFTPVAVRSDAATFRLTASEATRAIYPFEFSLDLTYAVRGPCLTVEAVVANLGDRPLPASFGFHPAFRWPLPFNEARDDHRIVFERAESNDIRRIGPDGLMIAASQPTPIDGDTLILRDSLFVDDAVILDRLASRTVRYGASTGGRLRIDFPDFPILGIWTKPGAGFICIEPWAGLPDPAGFDRDIWAKPGIFPVEPGADRSLRMWITVEGD